jgi:GMP synthase-like glutamine amidotransferase
MKKTLNVLTNKSAGSASYLSLLSSDFEVNEIDINESRFTLPAIDLILFTGGEDVNPQEYGESVGKFTHFNKNRDYLEKNSMFFKDSFRNIPKLGICRGAQFLTVLSGGSLIQHVNGHAGSNHSITFKEGAFEGGSFEITSTHHQMMFPYNMPQEDYSIIAYSSYFMSNTYLNGNDEEKDLPQGFEECEIVFYPKTNSLCIQGHPEFSNCPENTRHVILETIKTYLKL